MLTEKNSNFSQNSRNFYRHFSILCVEPAKKPGQDLPIMASMKLGKCSRMSYCSGAAQRLLGDYRKKGNKYVVLIECYQIPALIAHTGRQVRLSRKPVSQHDMQTTFLFHFMISLEYPVQDQCKCGSVVLKTIARQFKYTGICFKLFNTDHIRRSLK